MTNSAGAGFGIVVHKDVMVAMRDGTRLATDIYRPANNGELLCAPLPTILVRTSYDKTASRHVEIGDFFTRNGYAVILQDLRGRFNSEGTGQYFHTANPHEGLDGYDTVEWIAKQSWSNGKVGSVGSSHAALVQTHMALYRPPHLTAIWPDVGPINSYDHQSRRGGAMQLQMFGALFVHAMDAQEIRGNPVARQSILEAMEHMRELVFSTPFKPGHTPLAVVPNLEKTLFDYYYRGDYDEFWSQEANDFERQFHRHADIPATYTGGWYDLFANATTSYFARMSKQNTTTQRLIMGPWTHTSMRAGLSYSGDVDFGPESVWGNQQYFQEQLSWFDRWLKESPNGVDQGKSVHIFVMGGGDGRRTRLGKMNHGGRWRMESEWPLERTQYVKYYFHSDGSLNTQPANESESNLSFTFDPANPIPTIGASSSGLMEIMPLADGLDPFWGRSISPWLRFRSIVVEGATHQQEEPGMVAAKAPYLPLATRPDVLVFQTAPLEENVEVTGPIVVQLWISSSAVDTDFTAKLIDVYPPNEDYPAGYHMNLTDSIIRVRYRDSWEKPELIVPEKIYFVRISLAPTSNLFQAKHRIRVDISSSNFPRFDVNPNTGEPTGRHTHSEVARNTVHLNSHQGSYIVLPIVR